MHKTMAILALAASIGGAPAILSAAAYAQTAPGQSAPPARYSVSKTLVGALLDDPAAAAVLKKLIPTVYANDMFQQAGRQLTLKDIQQYESEALSDENLAKIQAELDKLPVKN